MSLPTLNARRNKPIKKNMSHTIDYQSIIDFYYKEDTPLRHILLTHSRQVAKKALHIAKSHPEMGFDTNFLEAAAMLHDIGIIHCDAVGIHCHGTEHYIRHGIMGASMVRELMTSASFQAPEIQEDLERIARVCQRHTGAGITRSEIATQRLPLPLDNGTDEPYMPETKEEELICYADKFFSKTRLTEEKTFEQACRSLAKFGQEGVARFQKWHCIFDC